MIVTISTLMGLSFLSTICHNAVKLHQNTEKLGMNSSPLKEDKEKKIYFMFVPRENKMTIEKITKERYRREKNYTKGKIKINGKFSFYLHLSRKENKGKSSIIFCKKVPIHPQLFHHFYIENPDFNVIYEMKN